MSLRLPRFLRSLPLTESNGTPTLAFHQWWDTTLRQIENSVSDIELALAVAGVALDGGGALPPMNVRTVTASEALSASDTLVLADATAANVTLSLPPAASEEGRELIIKKISDPPNSVIVTPNGSEAIDGNPGVTLSVKNEVVHIVSNGTGWWVI